MGDPEVRRSTLDVHSLNTQVAGAGLDTSPQCEDKESTPVHAPAKKSVSFVTDDEADANPTSTDNADSVPNLNVFKRTRSLGLPGTARNDEERAVEEECLIVKKDDDEQTMEGMSQRDTLIWSERARMVALISAAYSISVFAVSLTGAIALDSASLLSLSLEALADFLGDCLVFWRFSGDIDEATGQIYDKQVRTLLNCYGCPHFFVSQASVLISGVMLTSCIIVAAGAIRKLAHAKHPHTTHWVLYIHGVIFVISSVLTAFKVWIARAIKSNVLMLDAVTGGVVAFLSGMYIVNAYLANRYPETWFLDSSMALIASAFIIIMACRTLHNNDFTTRTFWEHPEFSKGNFASGTPRERTRARNAAANDGSYTV